MVIAQRLFLKKIFIPLSSSGAASLEKISKNVNFSLWGKQCIVLPKWTFFRVLANCGLLRKWQFYINAPNLAKKTQLITLWKIWWFHFFFEKSCYSKYRQKCIARNHEKWKIIHSIILSCILLLLFKKFMNSYHKQYFFDNIIIHRS